MNREHSYFEALKSAYDVIFEVSLKDDFVKCIHGKDTSEIGIYYDIVMTVDSAKMFWTNNYIIDDDKDVSKRFFDKLCTKGSLDERPLQIDFHIKTRRGMFFSYIGVGVKLDDQSFLFCCRNITDVKYSNLTKQVKVNTFGYFDVFINDEPISFSSEKAKELLAVLVDHEGSYVSTSEAISYLWEDKPNDPQTQSNYRKVAYRLKKILSEADIENIVEISNGKRRIIPQKVQCDLYDYIKNKPGSKKLYKGSYMENYSWGELKKSILDKVL